MSPRSAYHQSAVRSPLVRCRLGAPRCGSALSRLDAAFPGTRDPGTVVTSANGPQRDGAANRMAAEIFIGVHMVIGGITRGTADLVSRMRGRQLSHSRERPTVSRDSARTAVLATRHPANWRFVKPRHLCFSSDTGHLTTKTATCGTRSREQSCVSFVTGPEKETPRRLLPSDGSFEWERRGGCCSDSRLHAMK